MAEGQTDQEIEAIRSAYAAIKGLDRGQWTRALEYLATRMAEDDRGSYIGHISPDIPTPVQYVVAGHTDEPYPTPEEAVGEATWQDRPGIFEVNGIAVVSQRFAVWVPSSDDCILEWFDSRDAAEVYLEGTD